VELGSSPSATTTRRIRGRRHRFGTVGSAVAERLCLDDPPYELENAFQSAIDAGEAVYLGVDREDTGFDVSG